MTPVAAGSGGERPLGDAPEASASVEPISDDEPAIEPWELEPDQPWRMIIPRTPEDDGGVRRVRRERAPALQRRNVVAREPSSAEIAATEQAEGVDWSNFSVGRAIKLLHSPNKLVVRRALRRLHIRWWHAPPQRMDELLHTAGTPQEAVDLCQLIYDTCPVCRIWMMSGVRSIAT